MIIQQNARISPSILARKILCPAYTPKPYDQHERVRFLGFHAMATVKVISRHLKLGYALRQVEHGGRGYRIDLLFESHLGTSRLVEVKSSKKVRETHRLQAALYNLHRLCGEIVVSNSETDEVLDPVFIQETQRKAEAVKNFLINDPETASKTYMPNDDTCYTCGNSACPCLDNRPSSRGLSSK